MNFNSQPHEEADTSGTSGDCVKGHFNSQPHEEADDNLKLGYGGTKISTRSLTRRLTIEEP